MGGANPRYFRRGRGYWHKTWNLLSSPRVISACGISVCPEDVEWLPRRPDGSSDQPTERRCVACFRFAF